MHIQLIVFDIAGTTVRDDNKVASAFQAALTNHGFNVALADTAIFMGYEKNKAIRDILSKFFNGSKHSDELINQIHHDFIDRMLKYYRTSDEIKPLANVEETFAALHKQGIRIALDTGFSRNIADAIISKLNWWEKGLIDFMIASDEVKNGRPYPDMIKELMQRAQIEDPKKVVKVGDTEVDILEGRNAGCIYSIGITTGSYNRSQLLVHNPSFVIDDIRELLSIINPPEK
ncbi:phosphonatase-like hydrolase [bacterium A37T11]|nr:phosphonatase-like hydrolase [bacterium A37T11]